MENEISVEKQSLIFILSKLCISEAKIIANDVFINETLSSNAKIINYLQDKFIFDKELQPLINDIINNHFLVTNDLFYKIKETISSNKNSFLAGENPGIEDLIIVTVIKQWIDNANVADFKENKLLTGYYGRVLKNYNTKKKSVSNKKEERPADDVTRWNIVVGKVLKVWPHESSDKLWCELIEIGEAEPRQIGSGLRNYISSEDFTNSKVFVLKNMKPKNLGGFMSSGMVICASSPDHSDVELLLAPDDSNVGDVVTFENLTGFPDDVLPAKKNFNAITAVMEHLKTDNDFYVNFKGHKMLLNNTPIKSKRLNNALVG